MTRVFLVEDNKIMQRHFMHLLSQDPSFELVGVCADAKEAETIVQQVHVDLILMDVQTAHNHSGIASAKRIKDEKPGIKILIVTSLIDAQVLSLAKANHMDGLWYKDHSDVEVLQVIHQVMAGEHPFPENTPDVELENVMSSEISPRQMDILRDYIHGLSYAEIAQKRGITIDGVRWNIKNVVSRTGFSCKEELFAALIDSKLIVTTLKDD